LIEVKKHNLTVFNAQRPSEKNQKSAWSPYYDKTFIFKNYVIDGYNNVEMFNTLVSYWVLNIPLSKLPEPIRTYRRKETLEYYCTDEITYMILDIDKVRTAKDRDLILQYFSKYKCILGESKSYNNKDNFNMKGILFIEPISINDYKNAISNLSYDLKDLCEIDEAVGRIASFNAPIQKNKILLNKDKYLYKCSLERRINTLADEYTNLKKGDKTGIVEKFNINDITGDSIEDYCLNVYKSMGFEAMKANENGSIQFKHPSETKSIGGYFWFNNSPFTMHHFNSTRSINIFDAVRSTEIGKKLLNTELDYDKELMHFNTSTKVIQTNERYLKVRGTYDGKEFNRMDEIEKFISEKDGLYCIKSPMGTGKSTIIKAIIDEANAQDLRTLIITNRISVAVDFANKYGMKIYNKDQYNLNDSIIVQFDSLWKYDIKNFDLVIMDEFISLMCHSRNNLGNSSLNLAKFFGAFNKKLVIADAFLTGYENFLLENKTSNVYLLNNHNRDKTILYSYENKNYFFQSLLHKAKQQKITVSGTSLNFLRSTKRLLEKHGKKCILLTADTPGSTKKLIYELFKEEEHDKWDVFLYSPSLTVGVSNLNNIYAHYHYDTSMSTDVISSIQMIKRTRKATEIHMYISDRTNYVKTTYDSVRDEYLGNIGKNIDQNFLFSVDDYGTQRLSKIGKNAIKIDTFKNILEFNHKKAMFWLMKYHFFNEPRIIENKFEGNILTRYSKELQKNKEEMQQIYINDFLNLSDSEKIKLLLKSKHNELSGEKILNTLVQMNDELLPDTSDNIREKILKICIKDKNFITKCKNYRVLLDFTQKFVDETYIKTKISDAMIRNESTVFFSRLLKLGQVPIKQYYIHADKKLLYILKEAGYKRGPKEINTSEKDISLMSEFEKKEFLNKSQKVWRVDPNIKQFYGFIKQF